jgi:sulfoxide reductase catalytic subunit YedY
MGLLFSPVLSGIQWCFAKTQRVLLPKGTKSGSLVNKNPASLDTRNLTITPLKDFETMGLTDHEVVLEDWRLEVKGRLKNPLGLGYSEVLALPSIEKEVLLICPGIFVNHGSWKGVSMDALLEMAQMEEGVTHVTFRGPKGPYEKVQRFPLQDVLSNKVFLAYGVNGETLPQKHGFPLRAVAGDFYGYDWIKYVCEVTVDKIEGPQKD